ncbi:MAG TPA: hypothetical protein DEP66_06005 [Acidimicrobiaceae bacterium]|nr:hypothetical protein [Acidimicrobiaceae bacterium]HCB37744.1 hypothetical protein [Acidimicrobiaceae bacterium]
MTGTESLAGRAIYVVGRHTALTVFRLWNRISVSGLENIPYGSCVWAPVHRSYIDTLVHAVVPVPLRFMAKKSMWKYRPVGWAFDALGAIPVARSAAGGVESLRIALAELESGGRPMVTFPEGGRRDGPRVHPLEPGAVYMAARAQVPIVPVGIGGTAAALPRGARFMYPRRIRVVIGEPMEPLPRGPTGRVSRSAVNRASAELRERIQTLFDEANAFVGTPNEY